MTVLGSRSTSRRSGGFRASLIAAWCALGLLGALFSTPLLLTVVQAARLSLPEQRAAAGPLQRALGTLRGAVRKMRDAPPGLSHLKAVYDAVRLHTLRSSPNPKVVVGHERDWLFFLGPQIGLPTYTHHRPFTPSEVAHWQRFIAQRVAWFEARGITYLMVIVPSKSSIYPQYIPPRIARQSVSGRTDQLLSGLPKAIHNHVADLRPVLARQARRVQNYYRLDSHWNDTGAYWAYRYLLRRLHVLSRTSANPLKEQWARPVAVHRRWVDSPRGDLLAMLNHPRSFTERTMALETVRSGLRRVKVEMDQLTRLADPGLSRDSKFYPYALEHEPNRPDLPKCVALRDSMFHMLEPYMAQHCRRLVLLKHHDKIGVPALELDAPYLAAERPDIVIEEFVERLLTRPHNAPPRLLGDIEEKAFPPTSAAKP